MKKSDLIKTLATEMNISYRDSSSITETILKAMTDSLIHEENIEIRGFGSFKVKQYDSYTGRNPKTGQTVIVPPKKLPYFKVSKELHKMVNNMIH